MTMMMMMMGGSEILRNYSLVNFKSRAETGLKCPSSAQLPNAYYGDFTIRKKQKNFKRRPQLNLHDGSSVLEIRYYRQLIVHETSTGIC